MKEIVTDELKAKLYKLFEQHDKIVEEQDEYIEQLRERNKHIQSENTRLKAERDKAVEDIRTIRGKSSVCHICKFVDLIGCCHKKHCFEANEYFKWRGLEEAE